MVELLSCMVSGGAAAIVRETDQLAVCVRVKSGFLRRVPMPNFLLCPSRHPVPTTASTLVDIVHFDEN